MSKLHKLFWMSLVMLLCVGCDQITKSIAQENLKREPVQTFLGDTFRLQYAENTGAFLSLGSGLSKNLRTVLFTVMSGALLIALVFYVFLSHEIDRSQISNLADRIINDGRVVDFMNVGIGNLRTGIFNVADVTIMAGMAYILIMNIYLHKKNKAATDSIGDAGQI